MRSQPTHPRLESPPAHVLPADRDLAEYHEAVEAGPSPVVRGLVGTCLGLALGIAAALLVPRRRHGDLPDSSWPHDASR